jgi:ParB-like chromosome segregation protein Spo0J
VARKNRRTQDGLAALVSAGRGILPILDAEEVAAATPIAAVASAERTTHFIDVTRIVPSPFNRRRFHGDDAKNPELVGLGQTIVAQGLIQPITVRPYRPWFMVPDGVTAGAWVVKKHGRQFMKGDGEKTFTQAHHAEVTRDELNAKEEGRFEIIAGERRWRAAKVAGLKTIETFVVEMGDADTKILIATENLQRKDLSVLEEADSVGDLLDAGWTEASGRRQARPAGVLGRSPRADPPVVAEDQGDARRREVASLWAAGVDADAPRTCGRGHAGGVRRGAPLGHGLRDYSERELKESMNRFLRRVDKTPWDPADATLLPIAGACTTCHKRNDRQALLFCDEDDEASPDKGARCLDAKCYDAKASAHVGRIAAKLRAESPDLKVVPLLDYEDAAFEHDGDDAPADAVSLSNVRHLECKKGDKGATPGLVVNGPRAGKVIWHKPQSNGAASREPQSSYQPAGELETAGAEAARPSPPGACQAAEAPRAQARRRGDRDVGGHPERQGAPRRRGDLWNRSQALPPVVPEPRDDRRPCDHGRRPGDQGGGPRRLSQGEDGLGPGRPDARPPREPGRQRQGPARRRAAAALARGPEGPPHAPARQLVAARRDDDAEDDAGGRDARAAASPQTVVCGVHDAGGERSARAEVLGQPRRRRQREGTIVSGKTAAAGDDTPERVAKKKRPKDNARKPQWAAAKKPPPKKGGRSKKGGRVAAGAAS